HLGSFFSPLDFLTLRYYSETLNRFLEPVQNLASKSETGRKRMKKRSVHTVHEHFEGVFNAVSPQRSRL
ncbi:hypothetical protein J1C51_21540, partial [Chromobacterium haemolyticum]